MLYIMTHIPIGLFPSTARTLPRAIGLSHDSYEGVGTGENAEKDRESLFLLSLEPGTWKPEVLLGQSFIAAADAIGIR